MEAFRPFSFFFPFQPFLKPQFAHDKMEYYSQEKEEYSRDEQIEYIPASKARDYGRFELSEEVKSLFPDSPVEAILT